MSCEVFGESSIIYFQICFTGCCCAEGSHKEGEPCCLSSYRGYCHYWIIRYYCQVQHQGHTWIELGPSLGNLVQILVNLSKIHHFVFKILPLSSETQEHIPNQTRTKFFQVMIRLILSRNRLTAAFLLRISFYDSLIFFALVPLLVTPTKMYNHNFGSNQRLNIRL